MSQNLIRRQKKFAAVLNLDAIQSVLVHLEEETASIYFL